MKKMYFPQAICAVALVLLAGTICVFHSPKPLPEQQETVVIETGAIYHAVDTQFFSHQQAAQAVVTGRQLYQRRLTGQQEQYVVEYTYHAAGDSSARRSQYLVTRQPDSSYQAEWVPVLSDEKE